MTTQTTNPIVMRFQGLAGAVVNGVQRTGRRASHEGPFYWSCAGCGETHDAYNERELRQGANGHAAQCRALPLSTDQQ